MAEAAAVVADCCAQGPCSQRGVFEQASSTSFRATRSLSPSSSLPLSPPLPPLSLPPLVSEEEEEEEEEEEVGGSVLVGAEKAKETKWWHTQGAESCS